VEFLEANIHYLPFSDGTFDAVISNGVINLSPAKHEVFAEAARVLRPGGRLAVSDIVSDRLLPEHLQQDLNLWIVVGGAIPRRSYLETIEEAGFRVEEVRTNDYPFGSELALGAGLESISVAAVRET
jgi:arsenite methyltransferase